MQKSRQRNGPDKENISPEYCSTMTQPQIEELTQGNGIPSKEITPEYNIKVTNKYIPLNDVANLMDTELEEAENIVKKLRLCNQTRQGQLLTKPRYRRAGDRTAAYAKLAARILRHAKAE